jgi:hypothetical protein
MRAAPYSRRSGRVLKDLLRSGSAGLDNVLVDEAVIEREDVLVIMGALADLVVYVRDIKELLGEDGDEEGDEEGEG